VGSRTALLVFADGAVAPALRRAGAANAAATVELVRRAFPGYAITREPDDDSPDWAYPPADITVAGALSDVDIVVDQRFMVERPSRLPEHLIELGRGRRAILHVMHSGSSWFAYGIWDDCRLVRALSVTSADGFLEDIGEPLPAELSYQDDPANEELSPQDLGLHMARALFGLSLESPLGTPTVGLHRYRVVHSPVSAAIANLRPAAPR
jgi:hypothetical protein